MRQRAVLEQMYGRAGVQEYLDHRDSVQLLDHGRERLRKAVAIAENFASLRLIAEESQVLHVLAEADASTLTTKDGVVKANNVINDAWTQALVEQLTPEVRIWNRAYDVRGFACLGGNAGAEDQGSDGAYFL